MLFTIALRNVSVHWRQSLAALLSISAAFFSFVLFQGYMLDVSHLYLDGYRNRSMYGDVILENKDATSAQAQRDMRNYKLTKEDQDLIQSLLLKHSDSIEASVQFLNFQGLISTGKASKILLGQATDIESGKEMREQWIWNTLYGEPLHVTKAPSPVVLGVTLARQLGCTPDKEIYSLLPEGGYPAEIRPFHCMRRDMQMSVTTDSGALNAMDFEVVGLVDAGYKDIDSRYLNIPLPLAQQLLNTDKISFWTVKLKQGTSVKDWVNNFDRELKERTPQLLAIDWRDHLAGDLYKKTLSLLNIFRNFVTIVVAFISILSVMNTMVKIVKERTREIGTLLSLGFQRGQVLSIFLMESFFLGFLGCSVGALLSLVVTGLLNAARITYKAGLLSQPVPFRVQANPYLYLAAFGLLLTITVVTSYFSCGSTIRKKIVDCLGHV
jgi:putative ABC transport system permease protein